MAASITWPNRLASDPPPGARRQGFTAVALKYAKGAEQPGLRPA